MRTCLQCGQSHEAAAGCATEVEGGTATLESSRTEELAPEDGPAPAVPADRVLGGRYRVVREIGRGGFGRVYEAVDARLQKRVAVKVLSGVRALTPALIERFEREALAASRIGHDGIVEVTDFDRDADGTPFLVMELLEGTNLGRLLRDEGRLAPGRALGLAHQAARALAAAHAAGILHRDLKPANLFLCVRDGLEVVKVLDFGVAKVTEAQELTSPGVFVGTPAYTAPEQRRAGPVDERTDVYALGLVLFEMLAGRRFADLDTTELLDGVTPAAIPTLGELDPALRGVLGPALAPQPDQRHATMAAFADALERARAALSARPTSSARRRVIVALAAVALVAATGAFLLASSGRSPQAVPTPAEPSVPPPTPTPTPAPAPAPPDTVAIQLDLEPREATVTLDGVVTAANPLRLPRSAAAHTLEVKAPGHRPVRRELRATEDGALTIRLERRRARGRATPREDVKRGLILEKDL